MSKKFFELKLAILSVALCGLMSASPAFAQSPSEIVFQDDYQGTGDTENSASGDAVEAEKARITELLGSVVTAIDTQDIQCQHSRNEQGTQDYYSCSADFQIHVMAPQDQLTHLLIDASDDSPVESFIRQLDSSFDPILRAILIGGNTVESVNAFSALQLRNEYGLTAQADFLDALATAIRNASHATQSAFIEMRAHSFLYNSSANPEYRQLALSAVSGFLNPQQADLSTREAAVLELGGIGVEAREFIPDTLAAISPITVATSEIGSFDLAFEHMGILRPSDTAWNQFLDVVGKNAVSYNPATDQYRQTYDFDDMALGALTGDRSHYECIDKDTATLLMQLSSSTSAGVVGFAQRELVHFGPYGASWSSDEFYGCF